MDNALLEQYLDIGGKLAQKWDFLLEGVEDEFQRTTTAVLLENTTRKINEQTNGLITEGFETSDVTGINRILLPIIRRVYPHLQANEFVTVQPMLTPTTQIFYLRYRYGSGASSLRSDQFSTEAGRKGTSQANDEFLRVPAYGEFGLNPYYSSQQIKDHAFVDSSGDDEVLENGEQLASATLTLNWTPVLSNTVKIKIKPVTYEQIYPYGTVKEGGTAQQRTRYGDAIAEVSFANTAGGTDTALAGTVVSDTLSIISSATFNESTNVITLSTADVVGSGQAFAALADWEYNQENNSQIPEMKINIETDTITAKERKLKTEFTQEAMQDLKALHNIDAEAELTAVISSMLIAEIDREILADLINGAAIRETYDYTADFSNVTARNFLDRNQALSAKIIDVAAIIHQQGKLGSANWCVTSPRISAKLEATRGYESSGLGKHEEFSMGITMAGTISGKQLKVFVDPYFPQNKVLIGYKGNSFLATSYVYAPYQPLYTTPLIYDPATLKPIRGFLTRYGKKMVIGGDHLLGVLNVDNVTV